MILWKRHWAIKRVNTLLYLNVQPQAWSCHFRYFFNSQYRVIIIEYMLSWENTLGHCWGAKTKVTIRNVELNVSETFAELFVSKDWTFWSRKLYSQEEGSKKKRYSNLLTSHTREFLPCEIKRKSFFVIWVNVHDIRTIVKIQIWKADSNTILC